MYRITPAAYTITHSYFNTMQQGIQAAHAITEMMHTYQGVDDNLNADVVDWARNHKTIKMLSGGSGVTFAQNIHVASQLCEKFNIPYAQFREPDIGDMLTSLALVITPQICENIENSRLGIVKNLCDATLTDEQYEELCDSNELVDFLKQLKSTK